MKQAPPMMLARASPTVLAPGVPLLSAWPALWRLSGVLQSHRAQPAPRGRRTLHARGAHHERPALRVRPAEAPRGQAAGDDR